MNFYLLFNLIALLAGLVVLLKLKRWILIRRTLKIGLLGVMLGFPWLHFGITQGAWSHGNPGPDFFGVPLNELALAFIMAVVNGGVLLLNQEAIREQASRRRSKNPATIRTRIKFGLASKRS